MERGGVLALSIASTIYSFLISSSLCVADHDPTDVTVTYLEFFTLGRTNVPTQIVPSLDDGASSPIGITVPFPFGSSTQTVVYVGTNGLISFGAPITDFSPSLFPLEHDFIVAPFWSDVDISTGVGRIRYEVHTTSSVGSTFLSNVSQFIQEQMNTSFTGQWMLLVEWEGVPSFGGPLSVTNTFQAVVITSGVESYALFTYQCGSMEWSGRATIGFNTDDTVFMNHNLSRTFEANEIACLNSPTTIWSNVVYQLTETSGSGIPRGSGSGIPSGSGSGIPSGSAVGPGSCVDAGFTDCCVTNCQVDGGCYCDSICYSLQDCCEDIEETCERRETSGSGIPSGSGSGIPSGSGSGIPSGSGSGIPSRSGSGIPSGSGSGIPSGSGSGIPSGSGSGIPSGSAVGPGSCVDAGFTDCCVTNCQVDGGCYCDSICYSLQDCCEDIEETCERPETSGSGIPSGSGSEIPSGSGSGIPSGSGSGIPSGSGSGIPSGSGSGIPSGSAVGPVVCDPPCENGACVANNTCNCADGFEGDQCTEPVFTECDTNPCENGGSCTLHAGSYICDCSAGFDGSFCQIPIGCLSSCSCSRNIECSIDAEFTGESSVTPTGVKLKCIISFDENILRPETVAIDGTFDSRYLSAGSLSFLSQLNIISRGSQDFVSCMVNTTQSPQSPLLESLGIQTLEITHLEDDGSFGILRLEKSQLQQIITEGDYTVNGALSTENACSLQYLTCWLNTSLSINDALCRRGQNAAVAAFSILCY